MPNQLFSSLHQRFILCYVCPKQDLNKMAASHEGLLRVSSSPGQLQMTCTSEFVALPLTKTIVGVWWLGDISRKVKPIKDGVRFFTYSY